MTESEETLNLPIFDLPEYLHTDLILGTWENHTIQESRQTTFIHACINSKTKCILPCIICEPVPLSLDVVVCF